MTALYLIDLKVSGKNVLTIEFIFLFIPSTKWNVIIISKSYLYYKTRFSLKIDFWSTIVLRLNNLWTWIQKYNFLKVTLNFEYLFNALSDLIYFTFDYLYQLCWTIYWILRVSHCDNSFQYYIVVRVHANFVPLPIEFCMRDFAKIKMTVAEKPYDVYWRTINSAELEVKWDTNDRHRYNPEN